MALPLQGEIVFLWLPFAGRYSRYTPQVEFSFFYQPMEQIDADDSKVLALPLFCSLSVSRML